MMLITLPIFGTFLTLGFVQSYEVICIGFAILGFIFGLKEAPTITYVSEIRYIMLVKSGYKTQSKLKSKLLCKKYFVTHFMCVCKNVSEPCIRGNLMAIGPLASSIGLFILYLLGSILSWRHVSLICAVVPIVILVAVFLVKKIPYFRILF